MARSLSIVAAKAPDKNEFLALMKTFSAERSDNGWRLARNGREIFIDPASHYMDIYDDEELDELAELLGARPTFRLALIFSETSADHFEERMARAVAKAVSELTPIVLDDNAGNLQKMPFVQR